MIVIFGASSDVGTKLAAILHWRGEEVRPVSRLEADLSTGSGIQEAMRGATIVVSCAHAMFTESILRAVPKTTKSVILMGSAWRFSAVPNKRADQVRDAERLFMASGLHGLMLHPTMIYGGEQENNIQRLLAFIKKFPAIAAPGGGHQQVQPVHIDDVVACLLSAISKKWNEPEKIAIGGPPLKWRDMALTCATSLGVSRPVISIPLPVASAAARVLSLLSQFDPGIVDRFSENVKIPIDEMQLRLGVTPRSFDVGVRQAIASWNQLAST